MAIRFTSPTIWQRDWYLNLSGKYQLFVHYLNTHCDCAGVWQPSFKLFENITGFKIDTNEFINAVNSDRIRVLVLSNRRWWLTGFIEDQCRTRVLKNTVPPQKGIIKLIDFHEIPYESYGYKIRVM